MDGKGLFEYVAKPEAMGPKMDELAPPGGAAPVLDPQAARAPGLFLSK